MVSNLFPRGRGYRDWQKIVCMRKNAEINCLSQSCVWKKIICRDFARYARFGEFKKKLSAQSVEEKLCKWSIDGGKNFLLKCVRSYNYMQALQTLLPVCQYSWVVHQWFIRARHSLVAVANIPAWETLSRAAVRKMLFGLLGGIWEHAISKNFESNILKIG